MARHWQGIISGMGALVWEDRWERDGRIHGDGDTRIGE